ncbi:MAG: archaemetzincin family Zn-dependent metalloprotease [Candidatus Eremiobacteraeota bacterium]|nr:archaemetzincin family Zn-dependent metalloprotease [Candidatus Eremiobacteraeota bacterium]
MREISIVPINAIEPRLLTRLASCLEERFLVRAAVRAALAVPKSALNAARGQLFFGSVAGRLSAAYETREDLILGVTEFDLYKTSHQFVFGSASETQRCAVVSLHRLRSEYYGDAPDPNGLFQRLLKECVHEIGHALGLRHCYNARCAMYYSNSVFDTDNKYSYFCEACDRRSRAGKI